MKNITKQSQDNQDFYENGFFARIGDRTYPGCKECAYHGYQCNGISLKWWTTFSNEDDNRYFHPDCWEYDGGEL